MPLCVNREYRPSRDLDLEAVDLTRTPFGTYEDDATQSEFVNRDIASIITKPKQYTLLGGRCARVLRVNRGHALQYHVVTSGRPSGLPTEHRTPWQFGEGELKSLTLNRDSL